MGMSKYTYVGPVITCISKPEAHIQKVTGCSNCKTVSYASGTEAKFCAKCGALICSYDRELQVRTHPSEVVGYVLTIVNYAYENQGEDFLVLGSNRKENFQTHHADRDDILDVDLTAIDMQADMAAFAKKYAKEIEKLREAYEDVKVSYGIYDCIR